MNNLKVGSFLQALRKAKGLTQAELAEYFGISAKTISKWECGDSLPEIPMLKALAEYYDVTVDEILNGERGTKKEEEKNRTKNEKYFFGKLMKRLNLVILLSFSILAFGFLMLFVIGYTAHRTDIALWVSVAIYFIATLSVIFGLYIVGNLDEDFSEKNQLGFKNKRFWFCYSFGFLEAAFLIISFLFYYIPSSATHLLNATLSVGSALGLAFLILCAIGLVAGSYPFFKYSTKKGKRLALRILYFIYSAITLFFIAAFLICLLTGEVYYKVDMHYEYANFTNYPFNALSWVGYGFLVVGFLVVLVLTIFRKYHLVGFLVSIIALLMLMYGIHGNLPINTYRLGSVYEAIPIFCIIYGCLFVVEAGIRVFLYFRKRVRSKEM